VKYQIAFAVTFLLVVTILAIEQTKATAQTALSPFETRCGWIDNPGPANVWFHDKEAQWIIGIQGGYQLPDINNNDQAIPVFKPGQWVRTNVGSYGYGCACLRMRVNKETKEVVEVKSSHSRPLSACRQDPALKKWKRIFK
jgi:hypothetical protein